MAFIFGGNTGLSYDQIQARRRIAEQMMPRGTPRNVGEGINAFAGSIASALTQKNLDKQDARNRAAADAMFGSVFGGGGSAVGSYGGGAQTYEPEPYNPFSSNMGTPVTGDEAAPPKYDMGTEVAPNAASIRQGLIDRGLPEHVADGFIMNFQDESGLRPDINEQKPLVPGSRGGFGLAQWTGPRRVALEKFAQQRGASVSDVDTQLDFLMYELQGPESGAARDILAAGDAGSAATAIVNKFLRPAEEHRARRASRYGGAGGARGQIADRGAIITALGDSYIQRDPGKMAVLQSLLQQQTQANDPMRQMQLEKAQLELESLRNPTPDLEVQELSDGRKYYIDPTGRQEPRLVHAGINATQDAPTVQKLKLGDGSEVAVQWDENAGSWVPIDAPEGGGTAAPKNKLTENQSKLTLFQTMMGETAPILEQLEEVWDPAQFSEYAAGYFGPAGNYWKSPEGRQYAAGASAWAEGALRIATGAAAQQQEIDRTVKTYFAQPGDDPATVEFKKGLRGMYSRAIRAALGERNIEGGLELPKPDDFAKDQGVKVPDTDGETQGSGKPREWRGEYSAEALRGMDKAQVESLLSAFDANTIPPEIVDVFLEILDGDD